MTYKQIIWGSHSAGRLKQRGFTRQDVRNVLAQGIWQRERSRPGSDPRASKRLYLRDREAKVVYIETATSLIIVTVEWTDEEPEAKKK